MNKARDVKNALLKISSSARALVSATFFKTGKGEYGEGDIFIGVTVPRQREIARTFDALSLSAIMQLLKDRVHECRQTALILLVDRFANASLQEQRRIAGLYLSHTRWINNWDLVDMSARNIIGAYLFDTSRRPLYTLVLSKSLWERRIAIVATHYYIGKGELKDTWKIASLLLSDKEDLVHKATGWMLREAGKKDRKALVTFLKKYHARMPRTMLRYAIKHCSRNDRRFWLGL